MCPLSRTTSCRNQRLGQLLMLITLVALSGSRIASGDDDATLPPLKQIVAAVERHFASLDDYEPGDLISRAEVKNSLDDVAELGWQPANRVALEKLVLAENAFLVAKLRTKEGTQFMRRIAGIPGAYDRLDRLSAMAGGRKLINTLIRDKGGHTLIAYLAESKGGENLGSMLTQARGGSNLNKPTGRIYTVDGLIDVLSKTYKQQMKQERQR